MVKCTCDLDVSYRDDVVQQIVIHAMRDTDLRVRVLSRNTNGELTTLAKLETEPVQPLRAEGGGWVVTLIPW